MTGRLTGGTDARRRRGRRRGRRGGRHTTGRRLFLSDRPVNNGGALQVRAGQFPPRRCGPVEIVCTGLDHVHQNK